MRTSRVSPALGFALTIAILAVPARPHVAAQRAADAPAFLPVISEEAAPLESITPVARDGHRGLAVLRKPPGAGRFPAVILIHGGLVSRPPEFLKRYALTAPPPSVFLAAGYVVVVITYRSRDEDPQSTVSLEDSLAAIEHVGRLPYVDRESIAVYGCSGGGDLGLEIAAATSQVRAVVMEEPASLIFAGVLNTRFPKAGPRFTPADARPIGAKPKEYYTPELQTKTRAKIQRIGAPMLMIQGDQDPTVVPFNNQVLIPELRRAGKNLDVRSYPGEPHCFAYGGRAAQSSNILKALDDAESFIRRYVRTRPTPVDPRLVTRVSVRQFTSPSGVSEDQKAIERAIENWNVGWKSKDAALASRDYTDDADWVNAFDMKRKGRAAIQTMLEEVFRLPFVMGAESEVAEQTVRFILPEVALVSTRVERRGQKTSSGAELGTRNTSHLRVFMKTSGEWRIVSHLISDARDPLSDKH